MAPDQRGNGKSLKLDRAGLRRLLAQLPARDRLRTLLEAPNSKQLVRSVPPQDLFRSIAEVGLADATRIVQLASPPQFRAFVDLGGWAKDRIDLRKLITWLRAAQGEDFEEFLSKVHQLDPELLELILRSTTVIHELETNPDVVTHGPTIETPEGKYLIELTVEGAELSAIRALLFQLMGEDPFLLSRLIEAIRWALPSELEESAYQFRAGRLADLGFPPLEEARAIFSFLDPGDSPNPAAGDPNITRFETSDFLETALGGLMDLERDGFEDQLRYLANSALVSEGAEPGDQAGIVRVGRMVKDYLVLGLEHLTGGDPGKAGAVLRENSARRIFQVGFSLTLRLKFRADQLARQPLAEIDDAYLLFPDEEALVRALRRRRPVFVSSAAGMEVGFRSRRELAQAEQGLQRAADQVALLSALLGDNPEVARDALSHFESSLDELGVDHLFAAIAAHALLDGQLRVTPVPRTRVLELRARLVQGHPAKPLGSKAVERAYSVLAPGVPEGARTELRHLLNTVLAQLASDLAPSGSGQREVESAALVHLPTTDS
jgi:hypothetical protein